MVKRARESDKEPEIKIEEDDLLIYFKLMKAGYAQSLKEARELTAREVLQALAYERFIGDYERSYIELNTKS